MAFAKSNAPHLIRLSSTRRFTRRASIRRAKSYSPANGPPAVRCSRIASIAASPTFFTPAKPKRMPLGTTVKSRSDEFSSGASTGMPRSRAWPMYLPSLSVLPDSIVSSAARYSRGWFAFRYAVW